MRITARYRSRCEICKEPIERGDTIRWLKLHGKTHVHHERCHPKTARVHRSLGARRVHRESRIPADRDLHRMISERERSHESALDHGGE
jgi:hypothetical protein